MTRTTLIATCALALITSVAHAQIVIDSPPVVTTYYSPAPTVTYAPTVSAAPVVTYSPTITAAPVTTYYTPTTTYYTPATTAFYAPSTTTYYGGTAIVTPVTVGRPISFGSSAYGTYRPYVPGQPVRNTFRFFVP